MKKYIAVILVLVLVLCAAACSNGAASHIFEVDSGSLSGDTFNHTNMISLDPIYTQERPAGQTRTAELNGQTVTLTYDETIYYPRNSRKAHLYSINGADDGYFMFNEDGTIYSISGVITNLEIATTDSAETVQVALEPAILHLVDLSKYDYVDVTDYGDENDFVAYSYLFWNEKFGYVTDFVDVWVNSDGTVDIITINDLTINVDEYCSNIDKSVEEELITARLKGIYNTSTTEYRSRTLNDEPNFIVYENELYVEYHFTCTVYDSETELERPDGCQLLIPVHLLSGD